MEQRLTKFVYESFKKLSEDYGFKINAELNEGNSYMIEYISNDFIIKIEKYFREFYTSIYKINRPDDEINLFNLLDYLKQGDTKIPEAEYFRKEKDIEECYRKQLNYNTSVIYEYYDLLIDFFNGNDYEIKLDGFENFWKNKRPEFYNKS